MQTNLVTNIAEIISDYRNDDGIFLDYAHVNTWIEQFNNNQREFILSELDNILSKRYISKITAKRILITFIEKLKSDYGYNSYEEMLTESFFLSLQPAEKSQSILLRLLKEVLLSEYHFDIRNCGKTEVKNYIYIDDILATGGTLFNNISKWWEENPNIIEKVKSRDSKIIIFYFFAHKRHYKKTIGRFFYNVDKYFEKYIDLSCYIKIENNNEPNNNLSLVWPISERQPLKVEVYRRKIIRDVDNYYYEKNYQKKCPEDFFRSPEYPIKEELFTSRENRIKFENIMLQKGIEIINSTHKDTFFRPLGFTKASKDFGFGALTFTWRNIANNTPLPFWFTGGNFYPLFPKKNT